MLRPLPSISETIPFLRFPQHRPPSLPLTRQKSPSRQSTNSTHRHLSYFPRMMPTTIKMNQWGTPINHLQGKTLKINPGWTPLDHLKEMTPEINPRRTRTNLLESQMERTKHHLKTMNLRRT